MILTDLHSHTYPSSHDAKSTLQQMVQGAVAKNLQFFGISNHFDYDIDMQKMIELVGYALIGGSESEYFEQARALQKEYCQKLKLLVGAEFGFSANGAVCQRYLDTYNKYKPDYIINSVHSCDGIDYTLLPLEDQVSVYSNYLQQVRKSLDAPYHYDIVGHLDYIVRYVPCEHKEIDVVQFQREIDDILQAIIAKDKILEVNSSTYTLPRISLPHQDIVERYFQLGGRKISFGSDAHSVERIADKRCQIVQMLKQIGFTYITVPICGEHVKIAI